MKKNQSMREQMGKSTQIAIGGVFSALCLLVMFLSSVLPFSTYVMPAIAGVMLAVVVIENGDKVAVMVYISVSILSLFIVPDYEVKTMFIAFFGYYPIIKFKLEKIQLKLLEYIAKLLLFVVAMVGSYYILINVIGVPDLANELGEFGKYSQIILLSLGAVVFLIYDYSLEKYILFYNYRLRKLIARQ